MANIIFNIAKGRITEYYNRVMANDPTNSVLVVIPIDAGAVSDATAKDVDSFSALVGAGVTERSANGWNRKVLHAGSSPALASLPAPDDTNDYYELQLPTLTWTAVSAGAVTDLVVCYDPDSTGGTDADLIPLTLFDFAQTPSGADIQMTGGAFYRAS